jgi:hypothetical protein
MDRTTGSAGGYWVRLGDGGRRERFSVFERGGVMNETPVENQAQLTRSSYLDKFKLQQKQLIKDLAKTSKLIEMIERDRSVREFAEALYD